MAEKFRSGHDDYHENYHIIQWPYEQLHWIDRRVETIGSA